MGTRADFYVGKGKDAEWLGSIAWDGYETTDRIENATTEKEYRLAVDEFLKSRDDATLPNQGWPWPWNDSKLTDCSYWFFDNKVYEEYGYPEKYYKPVLTKMPDEAFESEENEKTWADAQNFERCLEYPDMSAVKNVTMGGRSGLMVLSVLKE